MQQLLYFSTIFRHDAVYSTLSRYKAWKSEPVEFIKETAYKAAIYNYSTRVFPRISEYVYSFAHDVSASVVDSLMDLNWNDVEHIRNRNKYRNLGWLLLAPYWWHGYYD